MALTGMLLLMIMFFQTRASVTDARLKKHRGKTAGLADLLNYASVVDDGIIVCKNGAFMAAFLYQGEDSTGNTDDIREIISFRINQVFSRLKSGWMIHVDAARRPAPAYSDKNQSHFPDAISLAIDEERRQLFESMDTLYEGVFIITITWLPPRLNEQKFVDLMFDDEGIPADKNRRTHDLIETFRREIATIETGLSSAFSFVRLRAKKVTNASGKEVIYDEFLSWLQFCVTGLNHPVILPDTPAYIDALIGGQEFFKGIIPKIGKKFIQCVAIEGFPLESHSEILNYLAELPIEYRWSTRFIFMDNHEAEAALKKYQRKWQQKVRGFFDQVFNTNKGNIDKDAFDMVQDSADAIAEINTGLVGGGYYTSIILLMSENRATLESNAGLMAKIINDTGFAARVETINTVDAWCGSLPGHGVENVRRPLINTYNLAHLLPASSIWTGEGRAPSPMFLPGSPPLMHCVTGGNSAFRMNLHVRDLGHAIVFGPTRTGKSTLLATIALQWRRYKDARVIVFDKGMSMFPACLAAGGAHYTILGDEDTLAFAPFQYLETMEDRAWAMNYVDNILLLNGLHTTPVQRNEIGNAIVNMYQSGSRTFSEFCVLVQDVSIREALKQYTVDGLMGHLLDAVRDMLGFSDFMVFEMENLMKFHEKYVLPVLLYLFRRIEC